MIELKLNSSIILLTLGFLGLILATSLAVWFYAFKEPLTMRLFAVIIYSLFLFLSSMYAYNSITKEEQPFRIVIMQWAGSNLFLLLLVMVLIYFY